MLTQTEQKQVNQKIEQAKNFSCPSDLQPVVVKISDPIANDQTIGVNFVKKGKYVEGKIYDGMHKGVKKEIIKLI